MIIEEIKTSALRANNANDFKKIYDETFQMLFKISYRITNDEEVAEDLVHDSLIKAHEKAIEFPSLNDAKFWLICVVKNASLNYVKRKTRERNAYQKILHENKTSMPSGEVQMLEQEAIQKTREALNKLPANLREVLVLREYGDLNYKEIGKVLGITEGNVKVRVFRAREKLVKILGGDDVYMPN